MPERLILKTGVDVLWIARYDYRAGWSLRLHEHDYFQIILFLDGKGVFTLGRQTLPIVGGELFLIPAGEIHGLRADSRIRTLDVKFRVAPGALERAIRGAVHCAHWKDAGIAGRLERIRAEGEQKLPYYREICGSLLSEILMLCLRQGPARASAEDASAAAPEILNDPLIDRALACVRSKHSEQLTVREIARAADCTERTLRQHFHARVGIAPLAFLQRHRIARAKELIRYSDYTLKEVAEQVGFRTVHHFTRHFAAIEGQSPAAWRLHHVEGIRKNIYIDPEFENRILTVAPEGAVRA
jgi:AraC-like DNA-binding protein